MFLKVLASPHCFRMLRAQTIQMHKTKNYQLPKTVHWVRSKLLWQYPHDPLEYSSPVGDAFCLHPANRQYQKSLFSCLVIEYTPQGYICDEIQKNLKLMKATWLVCWNILRMRNDGELFIRSVEKKWAHRKVKFLKEETGCSKLKLLKETTQIANTPIGVTISTDSTLYKVQRLLCRKVKLIQEENSTTTLTFWFNTSHQASYCSKFRPPRQHIIIFTPSLTIYSNGIGPGLFSLFWASDIFRNLLFSLFELQTTFLFFLFNFPPSFAFILP